MSGSLAVVLFLAVAAGVLWFNWAHEKKRREALQRLAAQLGFSYQGDAGLTALGAAHGLRLFSQGHGQSVSNLMERKDGESRRAVFDFRWVTGSRKRKHSRRLTVFLIENPGMLLPRFYLRPENIFHKVGSAVGYQDFDFSSNPVFSSQYLLQGDNELAVKGLFQPSLLMFFEKNPGWQVEGAGTAIIACREQCPAVDKMPAFMEEASKVCALFR